MSDKKVCWQCMVSTGNEEPVDTEECVWIEPDGTLDRKVRDICAECIMQSAKSGPGWVRVEDL